MSQRRRTQGARRRRAAAWSLAVCCLLPVIVVLTAAGIAIDAHVAELTLLQALVALPVIGAAIGLLMFAGAGLWLLIAPAWVPRELAADCFLADGVGVFSAVSRWLFERAYGT